MELKDDSGVSVHTSKQDEADSSVVASSNPVVFQCSQCDSIVGDSTSWVSANKIMRTITIGKVTSKIGVKPAVEVSQGGIDKGSTYSPVYCIPCNEILGKQYLASPPDLDYIRGSFTLHVEKLNSYEVGSAQTPGNSDLADMVNVPSPGHLMARINKMQFLIVSMNDRIRSLEACLGNGGSTLQPLDHSNRRTCTIGESESVSSTDNFSTRPRADSFGSDVTDVENVHRENTCGSKPEMVLVRQRNNQNFDRTHGQNTREDNHDFGKVPKDRVIKKGFRSDNSNFRYSDQGSGQHKPQIDTAIDGDDHAVFDNVDNDDSENSARNLRGRKARREVLEMVEREDRKERSSEQPGTVLLDIRTNALQSQSENISRPGWNNVSQPGRSASQVEGFTSPNRPGIRRSRNPPVMETWPSPGLEGRGRESKKRKVYNLDDSQ